MVSFAQLQGGEGGHLGGVVEAFDLYGAVQYLGEEVRQLLLEVGCHREEREQGSDYYRDLFTVPSCTDIQFTNQKLNMFAVSRRED